MLFIQKFIKNSSNKQYYLIAFTNNRNKKQVSMRQLEQQHDYFQQAKDELLLYSLSSQFDHRFSPKNRKKKISSQNQKPQLALVKETTKQREQFMATFYSKRQNQKGQRGRVIKIGDATFKSNFECGNISMVDNVATNTYKISMENELNSGRMSIWFYFSVQGLKGDNTFIIQGFTKPSSLYTEGMKICYRQMNGNGNSQWRRGGSKISYNRSQQNQQEKRTFQLKFNFFFQSNGSSIFQFAYCFPYSFTRVLNLIHGSGNLIHVQTLAKSFEGKAIPLLTIGNPDSTNVIFASARIHPGQTVSSFMMQGLIKELISDSQYGKLLRENVLFKIVPMINPDGVTRGNYRFSVAGCDLNRKWRGCNPEKHPQIYYWRDYMRKLSKQKNVLMFIDLHGHSRKKNVFFYGCCQKQNGVYNTEAKQFPYLMQQIYGNAFKYDYCSFAVQKDKQGTARITMWKDLNINYVYTCQASFSGSQNGGNYLETDYEKIGSKLCEGMAIFFSDTIAKSSKNKQINQSLQKLLSLKYKAKQELQSNPELQKVGMNGDSGSQSDPDTGQNTNNVYQSFNRTLIRTSKVTRKSVPDKNSISKVKTSVVKRQKTKTLNQGGKMNTQKYENQFTISVDRMINTASQYRSQQLPTSSNLQTHFQRVNNRMRGTHMAFQSFKHKLSSEKNLLDPQSENEDFDKQLNGINAAQALKRKLMLQKGGAQYRRVRKIAEQTNRQNYSINRGYQSLGREPMVKGLVGINNLLQIQAEPKKSKYVISHFYPHSKQSKRGSADMYYKRQMKANQYSNKRVIINGDDLSSKLNVRCLGSRIAPRK